ncbi:hypothetical protein P692DRAFT_20851269 [Suillus brevipes Sb2]|nr:hypothetical protein P692DRAFT_20851269 [Suillus brevipes Sb2]
MPAPTHPFRNTESLLVIIPDDGMDIEAEARLYDELCGVRSSIHSPIHPAQIPQRPPPIFSRDIWLNDNSGTKRAHRGKHRHHFIPALPPKSPFARYRAAFLDRCRRQLQYWLSVVLLHPEIGACQAVRWWVMD